MLRVRLTDDLDVALERLKNQRHVNVSSWVRAALRAALKHELHVGAVVPDSAPDPTPPPTLALLTDLGVASPEAPRWLLGLAPGGGHPRSSG